MDSMNSNLSYTTQHLVGNIPQILSSYSSSTYPIEESQRWEKVADQMPNFYYRESPIMRQDNRGQSQHSLNYNMRRQMQSLSQKLMFEQQHSSNLKIQNMQQTNQIQKLRIQIAQLMIFVGRLRQKHEISINQRQLTSNHRRLGSINSAHSGLSQIQMLSPRMPVQAEPHKNQNTFSFMGSKQNLLEKREDQCVQTQLFHLSSDFHYPSFQNSSLNTERRPFVQTKNSCCQTAPTIHPNQIRIQSNKSSQTVEILKQNQRKKLAISNQVQTRVEGEVKKRSLSYCLMKYEGSCDFSTKRDILTYTQKLFLKTADLVYQIVSILMRKVQLKDKAEVYKELVQLSGSARQCWKLHNMESLNAVLDKVMGLKRLLVGMK